MKNKKVIGQLILAIIVLAVIIFLLVFFYNRRNAQATNLAEKLKNDFEYLNNTTITMVNSLNNLNTSNLVQIERTTAKIDAQASGSSSGSDDSQGSGSQSSSGGGESQSSGSQEMQNYNLKQNSIILQDKDNIDWKELEKQAEALYSSWVTITLDLNNSNVSGDNILQYNSNLDNLLISIKNQDKTNTGICLANLYNLIPTYMKETSTDENEIKLEEIKANIISAYSIADTNNWENVVNLLGQAELKLTDYINSNTSSSQTKQTNVNKSYILLKELIKSSNEKNLDLFYLKYINLINELEKV